MEAATRELYEEVGITVPLSLLGSVEAVEDNLHLTVTYFTGRIHAARIQVQKSEVEEARWWPRTSLQTTLSPLTKEAIKLYEAQRK